MSDIHFGVRNNDLWFFNKTKSFLLDTILKYDHQTHDIVILGDLFEARLLTNNHIASLVIDEFLGVLTDYNIKIIYGNHDVYHKNTNRVNTIDHLGRLFPNINVISKPTDIDGILYIPWITMDNREESLQAIENSDSKVCYGHFDIIGAEMTKGNYAVHGIERAKFKKFSHVFSGHYHIQSHVDNIIYIGNPNQTSFGDLDQDKGIIIHDVESNTYERVNNPESTFLIINYTDIDFSDLLCYNDRIMKVFVQIDDDFNRDQFNLNLELLRLHAYKVDPIEQRISLGANQVIDAVAVSHEEQISVYCDIVNVSPKTKEYLISLYSDTKHLLTED